jgi:intracellular septation protein
MTDQRPPSSRTPQDAKAPKAPAWLKPTIEFAPLGAFLVTWLTTKDLMLATAVVMVASFIAVIVSFVVQRQIPWMPLMTAGIVGVFGGLTLYLEDESFIKMKPSMINTMFAAILLGGLMIKKLPLRAVMGQALEMPERAWKLLTLRTAIFFLALAALNEIVWRTQATEIWVYFRFPGLMLLTFGYFATQMPFMMRHGKEKPSE